MSVRLAGRDIVREKRAGEGLAAQNSATLLIGIGNHDVVPKVIVTWPAGNVSTGKDLPAGRALII